MVKFSSKPIQTKNPPTHLKYPIIMSSNQTRLENLKVIVIGAGASGLAASQTLLSQGCQVQVLEARNRTGGRVQTVNLGDHPVDLGASWIHGIGPNAGDLARWSGKQNPIYELSQSNSIKTVPSWEDESSAKVNFYNYKSPASPYSQEFIQTLIDQINEFVDSKVQTSSKHDSLKNILNNFNPNVDKHLYDAVLSHMYCQDDAAELDQLSLKYFDDVWQFDGQEHVFLEGFGKVIEVLSKGLTIELNKVVTEINYESNQVLVKTSDGSEYLADKVIVTVPLAVLQSNSIKFIPELSSEKSAAINRLGMGLMDKLWLEFPEAFWKNDRDSDWICYASETPGLWVDSLNVHKYTGVPLIVMFNVADAARAMSGLTDQEVLDSAMKTIRNWYPDAPQYVRYVRTNWGKDPFALGSYPFVKVGTSAKDFDSFTEFRSTLGKVFFAGDATVRGMIGCVHAAYISGVDAANSAVESFVSGVEKVKAGEDGEKMRFGNEVGEAEEGKRKYFLFLAPVLIALAHAHLLI